MVKTLKEKDIAEPWYAKKTKHVTIAPKHTRAASKHLAQQQVVEDEVVEEPSAKGEAREKGKGKEDLVGKGKKKAKNVRPATTDVVLGKSKFVVADPEEMRRKVIADAEACGRVVKSVSQPATRRSCTTSAVNGIAEERMQAELVTGGIQSVMEHCGSPHPGIPVAGEGMDVHTQECGNVIASDGKMTPSAQRPGKEHFHEERQPTQQCADGLQESGKRKITKNAVLVTSSSERSDRAERAQKYRRLNMSTSPIILKERVRCISMFLSFTEFEYAGVLHLER